MKLKDKTIIVTGAGNGIGKELSKILLKKGSFVIGVDIDSKYLEETENELNSDSFVTYQLDVRDKEKIKEFKKYCDSKYKVDGLINNAGIVQPFISYDDMDEGTINRVMEVNFFGPIYLIKEFLPSLLKRSEAHIVNVSSMAGFFPFPKQSIYGASKAALKIFTEGLFAELIDTPVRVTAVMPGAIRTNILKNSNVEMKATSNSSYNMSMSADLAALDIVNAMEKDALQVFVGKDAKFMNMLYKLNPKKAILYINKKMKGML